MVILQASGLSKRNHNSLCICDLCRKQNKDTFQKVAELKNSGLHIYRYNPDETNKLFKMGKSTYPREEKQCVVLENTAGKALQRYEFINELCQYRTKCIRCKMTVSNIQNLLDKICTIKQNEIIGVCEYCKRYNVRGNCKRCEAVVGKFLKNRFVSERMQAECVEKLANNVLKFLKYIFDHCGVCNHVKEKCIVETSELQKICEHFPHFTERSRYIKIKDFPGPYIKEENSPFEATKKNVKNHLDFLQHKIKNMEEKLSFNEVNDTTLYGKETQGNHKSSDLMVKNTLDSLSMIMKRVAKNQDFNKNTPATSETQLASQIQKYFPMVQLQNDNPDNDKHLQIINISSKLNNKAQVYHDRDRERDYDKAATLQSKDRKSIRTKENLTKPRAKITSLLIPEINLNSKFNKKTHCKEYGKTTTLQSKDRKSMRTKENLTKPRAKSTSPRIPEIDLNLKFNKKTQHKNHDKTTTLQTKDIKSIPIKQNLTKARAKSTTPRVHEIKQSKSKNKSGYKIALPTDKRYVRSYYDIPDNHLQTKHSKFKKSTRDKEHHFFGKTATMRTKYLKLIAKKLSKDLTKRRAKSASPQLHASEELISKKKNVNKNEIPVDKQIYNKNYFSTRVVQLLNDEALKSINISSKLKEKSREHYKTATMETKETQSISTKGNLTMERSKSATPRTHTNEGSKSKKKNLLNKRPIASYNDDHYSTSVSMVQLRNDGTLPTIHLKSKSKKRTFDKEPDKTTKMQTKDSQSISTKENLTKGRAKSAITQSISTKGNLTMERSKSATPRTHTNEGSKSKKKNLLNKRPIASYNDDHYSTSVSMVQLRNDGTLPTIHLKSKSKKRTFDKEPDKTTKMQTKDSQSISTKENLTKGRAKSAIPQTRTSEEPKSKKKNLLDRRPIASYNDDHFSTNISMVQLRNDGTLPAIHINSKLKKKSVDKEYDKNVTRQTKDLQSISTKKKLTKGREHSPKSRTHRSEEPKLKRENEYKFKIPIYKRFTASIKDKYFTRSSKVKGLPNLDLLGCKLDGSDSDSESDSGAGSGVGSDFRDTIESIKFVCNRDKSLEWPRFLASLPSSLQPYARTKTELITDNQESIVQHQNKADMFKKMSMTEMVKSYKLDLETFDSNELKDIVVCKGSETEVSKIILGNEIVPLRAVDEDILNVKSSISDKQTYLTPIIQESIKPFKRRKSTRTLLKTEPEQSLERKWNFTYQLSNPYYIATGWTKLPKENIRKEVISYKMKPTDAKTNWFVRNQNQNIILSDNGTKLAEFDMNGNCKIYYKNGKIALEYFHSDGTNEGCRLKIYSDGEKEYPSRKFKPVMVLAIFDYSGNGIVYDDDGSIRLKYNQRQGFLVDKKIAVPRRWQWQWRGYGVVRSKLKKEYSELNGSGDSDPNASSVEYSYSVKEVKKKPHFKLKCIPYDIKVGPFKINDHFKLFIVDQSRIYLSFTETKVPIKVNVGMIKLYDETVTRMLVDINDCCTPFEGDTCVLGDDQSEDSSFT